jgi:NAD-dependent DNA ligase
MDIEGVGEQFVRRLWDRGLLRSMPDLYRLTPEQLAELEGYGEISSAKAVEAIQSSKAQPFSRVLFGLNIPKTGWVMARNLARHFGSVDALLAATQVELEEVEGIGPDRAELVAEWFADEENRRLVEELRALGLRMAAGEADAGGGPARWRQQHHRTLEARRATRQSRRRGAGREGPDSVSKKTTTSSSRSPIEAAEGAEAGRAGPLGGRLHEPCPSRASRFAMRKESTAVFQSPPGLQTRGRIRATTSRRRCRSTLPKTQRSTIARAAAGPDDMRQDR